MYHLSKTQEETRNRAESRSPRKPTNVPGATWDQRRTKWRRKEMDIEQGPFTLGDDVENLQPIPHFSTDYTGSMLPPTIAQPVKAQSRGGFWSGLFSGLSGAVSQVASVAGTSALEIYRQKQLAATYNPMTTGNAISAINYQRQLEANQRALELDRSTGVTSPMMSTNTLLILGAVAVGGLLLLTRK